MTLANNPPSFPPQGGLDPSHELPAPGQQVAGRARPSQAAPKPVNVGGGERWASVLGGAALTAFGLERRSLPGLALAVVGGSLVYRGTTGHCSVYASLGKNTAEEDRGARPEAYQQRGIHVVEAFTINKPRQELYAFWRNFENLPKFMKHLQSVRVTDDKHSHWVASAPAGKTIEWDAEVINDEPGALIAWRSLDGAGVDNAGSVRFLDAPAGRGTIVKVNLDYIPPGGRVGAAFAWLFGTSAHQQVKADLRNFKAMMEAGEIPTIEGQSKGRPCK